MSVNLLTKEIELLKAQIDEKRKLIHEKLKGELILVSKDEMIELISKSRHERLCVIRPDLIRYSHGRFYLENDYALVDESGVLIIGGWENNDNYRGNSFFTYKDGRKW